MRRLLLLLPLVAACAQPADTLPIELEGQEDALVGGRPATASEFPATVNMGGCTGAKVGPRHFMLAAHCVVNYEANELQWWFQPGNDVWISPDKSTQNATFRPLPIVQTYVPQSWFDTCTVPCGVNVLNPSHPPDLAVVVVGVDTPDIAQADVDLTPVLPGDPLVIMGYGCELGVGQPFGSDYARLKLEEVTAQPASALLHPGTYVASGDEGNVAASYVITPGARNESSAASLCPGDSGGPLYRNDAGQKTLVGVNAYYTFQDSDGVSVTNWHTRLDAASRYGIGAWLENLGVNVVGEPSTCEPVCDGKSCGPDGCGGVCGTCQTGATCNASGQCETPNTGCGGLPAWDESRFMYSGGELVTRNGRKYECTNNGHCFRDPAGPWGHFGWTDRGGC